MPHRTLARIDAVADTLADAAERAAIIVADARAASNEQGGADYAAVRLDCLLAEVNGLLDHVCAQRRAPVAWWWPSEVKRLYRRYGGGMYIGSLLL